MADGSTRSQQAFYFPELTPISRLRPGEIVVDLFAGGGGASHALENALARAIDIAINHNPWAIGMHAANHPYTRHLCEDVWEADPLIETQGRQVGWMHASPDCTHHSQARGGQPRDTAIRALAWVAVKWAGRLAKQGRPPRIISLENVEQILKWGRLVAKRDKATGRVVTLEKIEDPETGKTTYRVADPGEQVSRHNQFLVPDKRHEGKVWRKFVRFLERLGYTVEWRKLKACDFGAGTSRMRLYMVARCDGEPIRWPEPTHGPGRAHPYVSAGECIDWSIECPSIFDRKRPLADATHRRIARGIRRYVLEAAEPFIVGVGGRMGQSPERGTSEPSPTITAKSDSCVCVPTLVQAGYGERAGQAPRALDLQQPLGVVVAGGVKHAIAAPTLVPITHHGSDRCNDAAEPMPTITAAHRGEIAVAAAHLVKFRAGSDGADAGEPMPTITSGAGAARPAGAPHAMGVITAHLTAMAQNVVGCDPADPLPTVLAGATRFGVVAATMEQAAFLDQANAGFYEGCGNEATEPLSAVTGSGSQQRLVAVHLQHTSTSNTNGGRGRPDLPLRTILAGGTHNAVVECVLSPEHEAGALRVASFLMRYYGEGGQHGDLRDPAATITTKDRLALVTVVIKGTPYVIVDIGLRMLQRHELFKAQGFPTDYVIDRTADGRPLSISRSVAMCGNSVSPPPLHAIAVANLDPAESLAAAA